MTPEAIAHLVGKHRAGNATPEEQAIMADLFDEYRSHAIRLERATHDLVKEGEQAARLIDSMSARLDSAGGAIL